jgi:hypothetical protein
VVLVVAGSSPVGHPARQHQCFSINATDSGFTPFKRFWYDVGLFWMEFDNRTEARQFSPIFIIVNTTSTRPRGLEGELLYDFLARFQYPPVNVTESGSDKSVINAETARVPGMSPADFHPLRLVALSNAQFLDAEFTASDIPDQVGKTPAFAPAFLLKGRISFRKDRVSISCTSLYVAQQFWSIRIFHFRRFRQEFLHTKSSISPANIISLGICGCSLAIII